MRFLTLLLCILLLTGFVVAQQKYLVSPNQEMFPITKGGSASDMIAKRSSAVAGTCSSSFIFGYDVPKWQSVPRQNFGCYHKDVLGQWFYAGATGTIDTVYWFGFSTNGALDSSVFVRIHQSNIGKDYGPGDGTYPATCQSWGYWVNTNDHDNGIAAFPDDASDAEKVWHSTVNPRQSPGGIDTIDVPATQAPFGDELWGQGGYKVTHHTSAFDAGRWNKVAMMITELPCSVTVGQKFFISFKVNSLNEHRDESTGTRTEWQAWQSDGQLATTDANWPYRDWKFYEHDSGPSNCAGFTLNDAKRGWVARGPLGTADTLTSAAYNIWYSMTVNSNVPPQIASIPGGDPVNTFDNGPQTVQYDIWDCDPPAPGDAAVGEAKLVYQTQPEAAYVGDWSAPDTLDMIQTVGDVWEGQIPGQPAQTNVRYKIVAKDTKGLSEFSAYAYYKVTSMKNNYYTVDTGIVFVEKNISAVGPSIPKASFIEPHYTGSGTAAEDDGTAGPFALGGPFVYFGDTMNYAWVSINGGIGLSKTATDTVWVSSNGSWAGWDFPNYQHKDYLDTTDVSGMPSNFIAPMWCDMVLSDTGSTAPQFGNIHYYADPSDNTFTIEWDSLGAFVAAGSQVQDVAMAFRAILNKNDGTIEFQYTHPGTQGQDTACIIGMAMDTSALSGPEPGYIYVNRLNAPSETKPRPNWAIKFTPGAFLNAKEGWNLLSVSRTVDSYSKTNVYPAAVSSAFKYAGGYQTEDPLVNGRGYWLKYSGPRYAGTPGTPLTTVANAVSTGWNMIGTISKPVVISSIVESTPDMVISEYFMYTNQYVSANTTTGTLLPGYGYWVKVSGAGSLTLNSSSALPKAVAADFSKMNRVVIKDQAGNAQTLYIAEDGIVKAAGICTGEMPPAAPEFDARFKTTQGMVVTYPAVLDEKAEYSYPVSVSATTPVTVEWQIVKPAGRTMVLMVNGQGTTEMTGSGSVRVKNASDLAINLGGVVNVPKVFALGKNYPNPFNPMTKFTVDVPRIADVSVIVYDILGRQVATLMSGEVNAQRYELEWNAQNAPTGTYFIRMTSDGFNDVHKIMLVK